MELSIIELIDLADQRLCDFRSSHDLITKRELREMFDGVCETIDELEKKLQDKFGKWEE